MKTTTALINVFIGDQELYSVAQDICQEFIKKAVKTQAPTMDIDTNAWVIFFALIQPILPYSLFYSVNQLQSNDVNV